MLKITQVKNNNGNITYRLDGKIEGIYLNELTEIYEKITRSGGEKIIMDFSGVSYIDEKGLEIVQKMKNKKIRFINCSPFIRTLLDDAENIQTSKKI